MVRVVQNLLRLGDGNGRSLVEPSDCTIDDEDVVRFIDGVGDAHDLARELIEMRFERTGHRLAIRA